MSSLTARLNSSVSFSVPVSGLQSGGGQENCLGSAVRGSSPSLWANTCKQ